MDPNLFSSASLDSIPKGEQIKQILASSIAAVDPYHAVTKHLNKYFEKNDLGKFNRIFVVGAGKAGFPMSRAVNDFFDGQICKGQVTVKEGHNGGVSSIDNIRIVEASHPLPDQRGIKSTREIINILQETTKTDLVICLVSGGGPALLVSPKPGGSLEDIQKLTDQLLACGASIQEINTLRKQLDDVKGGGLAGFASPAEVITLILSDVVGDPLDMIASGPTVPNMQSPKEAIAVLEKYNLKPLLPKRVLASINTESTPNADLSRTMISNILVGNNEMALKAAIKQAINFGFNTRILTNNLQGEASLIGRELAEKLIKSKSAHPFMWVAGGETTVTLTGKGLGGRNQELALAAVEILDGSKDLALISLATDGGDGPTNAAGAIATSETYSKAKDLKMDPKSFLSDNDSYNFFAPLNDLIIPGPTQTNVNDLVFLFGF